MDMGKEVPVTIDNIPQSHSEHSKSEEDKMLQMELIVSNVLRYGVVASFIIVAIGAIFMLVSLHAGQSKFSVANFMAAGSGSSLVPRTLTDVLHGLLAGDPSAVITLGLLVLLATPVFRVAVSVLAFLLQHDLLYVAITIFVLTMLVVSFLVGSAG